MGAERMVREQIAARGITKPRVLAAMRAVPRDRFVPAELRAHAWDDGPQSIGDGQTISQPYIVALMAEALGVGDHDRVLDVGTGSGYAAAVLGCLAGEVYTIERHAGLAETARVRLAELGFSNVHVTCGDGNAGWPEHAPFAGITVAAAAHEVPAALLEQLTIGGRLVIPVGPDEETQTLLCITKTAPHQHDTHSLGAVRFVPLLAGRAS
jgi:protein-L-isoaspartate(D-aspartate) O-methyltransferase